MSFFSLYQEIIASSFLKTSTHHITMFDLKPSRIIVIFLCQSIFLDNVCYCQFHWGKNYQMEADNLRALLERYASDENVRPVEITPKVTLFEYAMIVINT